MTDQQSDRYALPLLQVAQAQKEVTHNEALTRIDLLLHARAENATTTIPPAAPESGQCWIVGASATGDWAGHDGALAGFTDGGWRFVAPRPGLRVTIAEDGRTLVYGEAGWSVDALRPDALYLGGVQCVGEQQGAIDDPAGGSVVDAEARAAIGAILAALRLHGLIALY